MVPVKNCKNSLFQRKTCGYMWHSFFTDQKAFQMPNQQCQALFKGTQGNDNDPPHGTQPW